MIKPTVKAGASQGTPVTALAVSVATPPRARPGSDGRTHVAYDLLSTHGTPVTITLTGVEVTSADGRPLASLSGEYVQVQNGELCRGDCTTLADFPFFGAPLYAWGTVSWCRRVTAGSTTRRPPRRRPRRRRTSPATTW